MSQPSRRPGREAIKEQKKARKKAQRELRQRQQAEGLSPRPSPTLSNGKSPYQTVEEERAARVDATDQQLKVYRAMLPVLLKRLSKIPDLRQPRKVRHKLTVLMMYGILCFAFQMTSRREANRKMTLPQFEANLRLLFPDLEQLPHNDTLARVLSRIDVAEIEHAHLDMLGHLMANKKFKRFLIASCYPIAIDGSQKFARAELWDEECLQRKVRSKKAGDQEPSQEPGPPPAQQYYVNVLESCLAFQNGMVIP
ncbi:MAG: transposase family protein [Pseudomonadota bacterium]